MQEVPFRSRPCCCAGTKLSRLPDAKEHRVSTSDLTYDDTTSSLWQDTQRPLSERVELLLTVMTLEEKVGQLGSRWVGGEQLEEARTDEPGGAAPDGGEGSDL